MSKITLNDVTLIGVDCVDVERLIFTAEICQKHIQFGAVRILRNIPNENENWVKIDPLST